ncbi:MAG: uroporphyrinogen-III C-methyltransferase [Gammaproteobacteria bacterium]|nr:uroporphyrinogen-III C-methyltransferase [Gammaproteobacteria bacterium]
MSGQPDGTAPSRPARSGRIALLLALIALAGTTAQWFGLGGPRQAAPAPDGELVKLQQRLATLDNRLARDREDLDRLATRLDLLDGSPDGITARLGKLEDALAKMPGGERGRRAWLADQATHFMRIANAQARLAHDGNGALQALGIADDYLREAADPKLLPVRKLIATEQAALRAVPTVDTEGLVLRLDTLADQIRALPLRQVPRSFRPEVAPAAAELTGGARALQALRNAFLSVVSIRRTEQPAATLMTAEAGSLVTRSLELELQIARLSLLRGEPGSLRTSLAEIHRQLTHYYDTDAGAGAAALATLKAITGTAMAGTLPDISASLAELNRLREHEPLP